MHYKYCPECGTKLIDKEAGDDGYVPYCSSCDTFYFDMFASCSMVLVYNEYHEVVVLSQSYISNQYKTLVSGYIKANETAEQTALREVEEEIGLQLERLEYAKTYRLGYKNILVHGFFGYTKKQDFKLSKEVDQAYWVDVDKVKDVLIPEKPGNAAFQIYKLFLEKVGSKDER